MKQAFLTWMILGLSIGWAEDKLVKDNNSGPYLEKKSAVQTANSTNEVAIKKAKLSNKSDRKIQVNFGLGVTNFTGNRGDAYSGSGPSYHLSSLYRLSPSTALTAGIEYSKHMMYIDTYVMAAPTDKIGAVETTFITPFIGFKHYVGTESSSWVASALGPYFAGRLEYWNQTNRFIENDNFKEESGNGIGSAIGFGLDIPLVKNQSSLNFELLYHKVNFFDSNTQDYRKLSNNEPNFESDYGYDDLNGDAVSLFMTYNILI